MMLSQQVAPPKHPLLQRCEGCGSPSHHWLNHPQSDRPAPRDWQVSGDRP